MRTMLSLVVLAALTLAPNLQAQDLEPIFNGKDLTGWRVPDTNPWWTVADGVLIGTNDDKLRGHVLETKKLYRDVIFQTDFRFKGDIDSGVMLRKPNLQVQIGVSRSRKKDLTCSIYAHGTYPGLAKGVDKLLKEGDWNTMRIEARGSKFIVSLNGEQVLEYEDAAFPNPAPIGLQIHGNVKMTIEFRNMSAASLDPKP